QIHSIKSVRPNTVDQLNDAQTGVTEFHWYGDDRLGFRFRLFVYLREKPRVLRSVRHNHRLAVRSDPARDSLPDLDAHIFQRRRSGSDGQLEIQLLLRLIEQQQGPVVRAQKLVDLLHNRPQHLVELQRRRERLPEFLEDRDLACFASLPGQPRIPAPFNGWKLFCFLHAEQSYPLVSFAEAVQPSAYTEPFAASPPSAFPTPGEAP